MMKMWIAIFLFLGCCLARAENLQLKDGSVLKNVTIISADPDRMLIVHDGGGCQVDFKDIVPDSLTAGQRLRVEEELSYYVLRRKRLETIRLKTELFEAEQRRKGLIEFEGGWVTPLERENILNAREERKIELERQRVQLAKEKAQLEEQQLQTEKARQLLEGESNQGTTYISIGYTGGFRRDRRYPVPTPFPRKQSWYEKSPYITTDDAAMYNRGPFYR